MPACHRVVLGLSFPLLGPLTPGTGWAPRSDSKYSRPLSRSDFAAANREHVRSVATSLRPSEHSATMFEEILEECKLGRVSGPLPLSQLLLQDTSACASRAFPVVQSGKVRRTDDWMRSHHNSAVWVCDTPAYASAGLTVPCPFANRQSVEWCSLSSPTKRYSTINSLQFGSSGSVWSYLRVADVLSFLAVSLLIVPSAHFVDDSYQSEDAELAPPGFSAFKTFHTGLGFRMKEPKEKRPARSHTLLGVLWTLVPEGVWTSPGPERVAKLVTALSECLQKGTCSGPVASKLAGKLTFVCSWVFGRASQAFLKPLLPKTTLQFDGRGRASPSPPS